MSATKEHFHINEQDLLDSYRGPDRHGRGHYPVSKTYSKDEQRLEAIKAEATFNAIMADLDGVLADFGDKVIAAYPAREVEQVLRKHLGLPVNPREIGAGSETLNP